jgi:uncharacterized membrane protein
VTVQPQTPLHPVHSALGSLRDLVRSAVRKWSAWPWETRALAASWLVFLAVTIFLSYQRYLSYQTNTWDLGINMQALWTTAFQGRFLYYTAELSWNSSGSLMGVHFNPFLLVVALLYRVVPGALTLFTLQSVAVCLSSLPLYLLAVRRTSRTAALAIALAYLSSAPLLGGVFYDFHSEAFVPLFGLTLWYAWETRKPRLLGISSVAFLSIIELTPIILGAIAFMFLLEGLWTLRFHRASVDRTYLRWMVYLPLVVLAISAILTPIWFAIPKIISPSTPPYTQAGVLGGTLSQEFVNLFNPSLVGQALSVHSHSKIVYLEVLLLAGLVLWVLSPRQILPALPWVGIAMLSSISGYLMPAGNQYTFLSFPFLLPATASGYEFTRRRIARLRQSRAVSDTARSAELRPSKRRWGAVLSRRRDSVLQHAVVWGLVVAFGFTQVYWSPLSPVSMSWEQVYQTPSAHTEVLDQIGELVPASASISVEPDLFSQFADRANAYPYVAPGVDYILFDITSWWFTAKLPPPATNPPWNQEVSNLTGAYGILASSSGVILLEAGYTGSPVVFAPFDLGLAPTSFFLRMAQLVRDNQSPFGAYIDPYNARNAQLWYGPYDSVPPGVYVLGLWLRATSEGVGPVELRATANLGTVILQSASVSPRQLGLNWTLVLWKLTVPFPTYLEVSGSSGTQFPGLEFGGAELSELWVPAEVT